MNNLKPETNTSPDELQQDPAETPSRVEPTETTDVVEATRKIAAAMAKPSTP
jgi:hypothetical protein